MSTQKIQVVVEATPEEVWKAITDPAVTPEYYYGFEAHYDDLAPGAPYDYTVGGESVISGNLREVDSGRVLEMTFNGRWNEQVAELPESVVRYELGDTAMSVPGLTHLTLIHEGLPDTDAARDIERGLGPHPLRPQDADRDGASPGAGQGTLSIDATEDRHGVRDPGRRVRGGLLGPHG